MLVTVEKKGTDKRCNKARLLQYAIEAGKRMTGGFYVANGEHNMNRKDNLSAYLKREEAQKLKIKADKKKERKETHQSGNIIKARKAKHQFMEPQRLFRFHSI